MKHHRVMSLMIRIASIVSRGVRKRVDPHDETGSVFQFEKDRLSPCSPPEVSERRKHSSARSECDRRLGGEKPHSDLVTLVGGGGRGTARAFSLSSTLPRHLTGEVPGNGVLAYLGGDGTPAVKAFLRPDVFIQEEYDDALGDRKPPHCAESGARPQSPDAMKLRQGGGGGRDRKKNGDIPLSASDL